MTDDELQWKLTLAGDVIGIAITVPGEIQKVGGYGLEIVGVKDDRGWRYKAKQYDAFEIVDATSDQNVTDGNVRIYRIEAVVGVGVAGGSGGSGEVPDLEDYATQEWVNQQQFLTQHQDISGKEDKMAIVPFTQSAAAVTVQFGYNKIGFEVNSLAITLPSVGANETNLKGLLIKFTTGANPDVSFTNNNVIFAESYEVAANSIVELNAIRDDEYWYITSQKFNTQNS
jgi:hypothetical protein